MDTKASAFDTVKNKLFYKHLISHISIAVISSIGLLINANIIFFDNVQVNSDSAVCNTADDDIGGVIYKDFNQNGVRESYEGGYGDGSITITAYDADNNVLGTDIADDNGLYHFTGVAGTDIRLELTGLPSFYEAGGVGDTAVQFVNAATCDQYFAIHNPAQYCQSNPDLVISCYETDVATGNSNPAMVRFPYQESGIPTQYGGSATDPSTVSEVQEIGAVWGSDYSRLHDQLFTTATVKTHADLPNGKGALYRLDTSSSPSTLVSTFDLQGVATANGQTIDFGTLCRNAGCATDPGNTGVASDYLIDNSGRDLDAFYQAGLSGIGDLELSEDDDLLFLTNLSQTAIITIDVSNAGSYGDINQYPLSGLSGYPECNPGSGESVPYALKMYDGVGYLGVTCNGRQSQDINDVRGYIVTFDPLNIPGGFTQIQDIDMSYARAPDEPADAAGNIKYHNWQPWINDFADTGYSTTDKDKGNQYPQPLLTNIDISPNNDIVASFTDRFGMQMGNNNRLPISNSTLRNFIWGIGDTLRFCKVDSSYELEGSANCPSKNVDVDGIGAGNPTGAGTEFYADKVGDATPEGNMGSAVVNNYQNTIASTVMDPNPVDGTTGDPYRITQGVHTYSEIDGTKTGFYQIVSRDNQSYGKSNGLGEAEHICNYAPIHIGNRVWLDTNDNGIQDADEPGIPGVTVVLTDSSAIGPDYATAVTDSEGRYFFSSDTEQTSTTSSITGISELTNDSTYTVKIALNDPAISDYGLARQDNDPSVNGDQRDSDGVIARGFYIAEVNTEDTGDNNYSFDFGFTPPQGRIGNTVFFDTDNDAQYEPGDGELPIENVTLQLFQDVDGDGVFEPGGDDGLVLETTTTDSNGKYWFEMLADGDYFVVIPSTNTNTSVTIDTNTGLDLNDLTNSNNSTLTNSTSNTYEPADDTVDNDDNGLDTGNTNIPAGYISISNPITLTQGSEPTNETLPGGTAGDDETEGNNQTGSQQPDDNASNLTVDFGFFALPDVSIDKLVDADGDSVFGDFEILGAPGVDTTPDPSTFQYQITVTNDSSLVNATSVEVSDRIPAGIEITAVNAGQGSVTTLLPLTGATGTGSDIVWNVGDLAPNQVVVLTLDANVSSGNQADFVNFFDNASSQNVTQVTAMTEDDLDSEVNNGTIPGFDPMTSQDDEDDARITIRPAIGNYVWEDTNADGVQDSSESGIQGVTVYLYEDPNGANTLIATITTGSDGSYYFGGLTPGTEYQVEFDHSTAPTDFVPSIQDQGSDDAVDSDGDVTTGLSEIITLDPGELNDTIDQGYNPLLSVGNLVFEDRNNNGVFDPATENGLPGVEVFLYEDTDNSGDFDPASDTLVTVTGTNGVTPGQAITDANGNWQFDGLGQGNYLAVINNNQFDAGNSLDGFVESTGSVANSTGPNEPAPSVDANEDDNDDNGTGNVGAGEAYVSSLITLTFDNEPTTDGDDSTYSNLSVDFGVFRQSELGSTIFYDTNSNGQLDNSESGVEGVTITIYDAASGEALGTATTDTEGNFLFEYLVEGDYYLELSNLPEGFDVTQLNIGSDATDNDFDPETLRTGIISLGYNSQNLTLFGGLIEAQETESPNTLIRTGKSILNKGNYFFVLVIPALLIVVRTILYKIGKSTYKY